MSKFDFAKNAARLIPGAGTKQATKRIVNRVAPTKAILRNTAEKFGIQGVEKDIDELFSLADKDHKIFSGLFADSKDFKTFTNSMQEGLNEWAEDTSIKHNKDSFISYLRSGLIKNEAVVEKGNLTSYRPSGFNKSWNVDIEEELGNFKFSEEERLNNWLQQRAKYEGSRTQRVLSERSDPLLANMSGDTSTPTPMAIQYQASEKLKKDAENQKLGSILSNTGDESANYLVSDKVQSTIEQAPSLRFASEQDPTTIQRPSLLAQKRALTQNKENIGNKVQNALKDAIDNQEKQAFESGQNLLNESAEDTPWSSTAKAALGTAVGGAALMAALSGSRGQQNNAQLYGQQPLY